MGAVGRVVIPYKPRLLFKAFHERSQRFSCEVVHRRGGKTVSRVNHLIRDAMRCGRRAPRYAYIAPFLKQAKAVAWDYLKYYSAPLVAAGADFNESELRVDYPNGAQVRLYGADNPDSLRGIYLDGVVLDEYAIMDPGIWPVVRPALADRTGWADFIGTPKGHNDFYRIWTEAQANAGDWYSALHKASQTGLIPQSELDAARRDLTPDQYEQEFECSFEAAVLGAYYGKEMVRAEGEGRLGKVPYDSGAPVHTAWDLGIGDSTVIWFVQRVGKEWRFIDVLEGSGVGLDWYVRELQRRGYVYGQHVLPHDVTVKELTTGKSRQEVLERLGIKVTICPRLAIEDGIQQVRQILGQAWFDRGKCDRGIEALKLYRSEFDEKGKVFRPKPLHDWTSHFADAMRYCAVGVTGSNDVWQGDYSKFGAGVPEGALG